MPRKEINNYIFYKIISLDNSVDLCYVGSTANWKARNYSHKSDCYNENTTNYNNKIYKTIRENGGWNNFKMIQLGTREQLTNRQAEQIEEEYRVELKANMNTRRCYRSEEQIKEYHEEYYEKNKDKFKEQHQKYYEENTDKFKEQHQKYYQENKDKLIEYSKNYREENRDKINEKRKEKVKCECGCMLSKKNLSTHKKSPKHIKLMNNLNSF
jgi:hypothetical protein